eukprot:1359083-Amorphochlora_amoeboformis.AAC.1
MKEEVIDVIYLGGKVGANASKRLEDHPYYHGVSVAPLPAQGGRPKVSSPRWYCSPLPRHDMHI